MENGFSGRLFLVTAAFAAVNFLSAAQAAPLTAPIKSNVVAAHVPGEMLVKTRETSQKRVQATVASAIQKHLGSGVQVLAIRPLQTDASLQVVRISDDKSLQGAIAALSDEPSIEFAEPNYLYHTFDNAVPADGLPNDNDFAKLWGILNTGQADSANQVGTAGSDINVVPVWKEGYVGSRDVVVAVIDTGIDWTHPDLVDNLFTNTKEIPDNGKDDDGNGFVDDLHGWNFAAKTNASQDDHNHGSHCSGTIGGTGNNGKGVAGVNWKVRLLPVKFLTASGSGSLDGAVESINYARLMKVNIMSNSWGGGGFSQALLDAIKAANDAGILFVAAAGNESNNNDSSPTYPASYDVPNVVAVAALDNKDAIASFSNYGVRKVHVAAPGVRVYSSTKGGNYQVFSGTSMACPHVAGVSALLWSVNPTWTVAELKERLIKTSQPVAGLKNKVMAKGRVNAYNALKGTIPPNDEPDPSLWKTVDFSMESPHPYKDHDDLKFPISVAGAKYIRVIFDKLEVEQNYDRILVESGTGEGVDDLTGAMLNYTSQYVKGDKAVVRLKADESNTAFGFKISKIQVIQ